MIWVVDVGWNGDYSLASRPDLRWALVSHQCNHMPPQSMGGKTSHPIVRLHKKVSRI